MKFVTIQNRSMKNIWKYLLALALLISCAASCGKEEQPEQNGPENETPQQPASGLDNIQNSYADKEVSHLGATVSVKFDASAAWTAELVLKTTADVAWASINSSSQSGSAKKGATVRVAFEKNKTTEQRELEIWVTVEGFEAQCVAKLVQAASGTSADSKINMALAMKMLNKYRGN